MTFYIPYSVLYFGLGFITGFITLIMIIKILADRHMRKQREVFEKLSNDSRVKDLVEELRKNND